MNSPALREARRLSLLLILILATAPLFAQGSSPEPSAAPADSAEPGAEVVNTDGLADAVFGGGCFWCMEEAYEKVPGVAEVVSGYAGGTASNPTYRQVVNGGTGHTEVVRVYYDPEIVSYEDLLYVFWRNVDLTDGLGQFCDRGLSYRPEIFYETEEQRTLAEASLRETEASSRFQQIAVPITPLDVIDADVNDGFWIAEAYHQDYYVTNSLRYLLYKEACGRVRRLTQLWGDEAGAPSFQKPEA